MQHNSHTACNLLPQCLTVLVTNNLLTNYCKCNKHKKFTFCNLQQKISGSHPAGTLCKLHATKKKGLEYISFSEWLTVPLL